MGEYSCERCRATSRISNVKEINVNLLVDGKLLSIPERVCVNLDCVKERGGTITEGGMHLESSA